jgi:hypothetical protein
LINRCGNAPFWTRRAYQERFSIGTVLWRQKNYLINNIFLGKNLIFDILNHLIFNIPIPVDSCEPKNNEFSAIPNLYSPIG